MFRLATATCTAALLSGAIVTGASAASVDPSFTSLAVFGDSLSDPGNLFAQTGFPTSPPYFEGRFSNGPVWAEALAAEFAATGRPVTGNFAFGGAQAAANADGIPDFDAQIELFRNSGLSPALGDRPLAAVWFGANDLFAGIPAGPDGVFTAVSQAQAALQAGLTDLRAEGFNDFLIFNLPDLGEIPLFNLVAAAGSPANPSGPSEAATFATDVFNGLLTGVTDGLEASGANVFSIDANALFDDLLDDPQAFGVSDTTLPCLFLSTDPATNAGAAQVAGALGQDVVCDLETEANERAFFDLVHPNAAVQAALGEEAIAALAPVPLPAALPLLLAGLGALAVGGRRRKVAR